MERIQELVNKAKILRKEMRIQEAISVLYQAHSIAVDCLSAKDLVDIHNQLILLYYLNNDKDLSKGSFYYARKIATKINYTTGLIEALMNKAWVETEKENFLEAITHISEALAIDEIVDNVSLNATALYIISKANYGIGEIEKGDKFKRLYQHKLRESANNREQILGSIEKDITRVARIYKSINTT